MKTPTRHELTSADGEYTRDVWFISGPEDRPHRLCVFLDGEHYLRDMKVLPVMEELFATEALPAMTCVFVSHVSGEARHYDYTCNDRYSRFIAEDVVAWASGEANLQAKDHLICGLSLSGLASAYLAFRYPAVFSDALCQSGSFWWLADHDKALAHTTARFWMSVGDQETAAGETHPPTGLHQRVSQIEGVRSAAQCFESLGGTVRVSLYAGGHAVAPWLAELPEAMRWLVRSQAKQPIAI